MLCMLQLKLPVVDHPEHTQGAASQSWAVTSLLAVSKAIKKCW